MQAPRAWAGDFAFGRSFRPTSLLLTSRRLSNATSASRAALGLITAGLALDSMKQFHWIQRKVSRKKRLVPSVRVRNSDGNDQWDKAIAFIQEPTQVRPAVVGRPEH